MSVEKVIQNIWSGYKPLTDAVPLGRLWKGIVPQDDLATGTTMPKPHVGLVFQQELCQRTTTNTIATGNLEMRVYSESSDEAEEIIENAKVALDGWRNIETGYGRVMDIRGPDAVTREESEDKPGEWFILAVFPITVCKPRSIKAVA